MDNINTPNPTLDALRPFFQGRKVILAIGPVAAAPPWLDLLRALGTQKPLLLADGMGTGPLPPPDALDWTIVCDSVAQDIVENLRLYERALLRPPPAAQALIDAYDPDPSDPTRAALVITHFVHNGDPIAGRLPFGGRRPQDTALEDKTIIDALWDRCHIPRAPSRVLPLDDLPALLAAAQTLDQGLGTVWAGDSRDGFHGGAVLTRHVLPNSPSSAQAAQAALRPRCDSARVMPFLEGIPCSIHGLVLPDRVLAFRPVEMITLRQPSGFLYAGCASLWDPPTQHRDAMRATVRAVGAHLHASIGYLGVFTIDGVMTSLGFFPSELNPRLGVGLTTLLKGFPLLPIQLINVVIRAGLPLSLPWDDLEAAALSHADAHRSGGAWVTVPTPPPSPLPDPLYLRLLSLPDPTYALLPPDADPTYADATLLYGPSAMGGFVRFQPNLLTLPTGHSLAPWAAAAFSIAQQRWRVGLPPLHPALDPYPSPHTP
jgi:hypothetical protein